MKSMFQFILKRKIQLTLQYIPSQDNPADLPSRLLSDLDCTLTEAAWKQIQTAFGPHSIDLMALPSNVRRDSSGRPLRSLLQLPCAQAEGTNVFAQSIAPSENAYVFPPFILVGPILRHLLQQGCPFSIVVPDSHPRKYWWPLLQRQAAAAFKLGSRGSQSVLLFPSRSTTSPWEPRPLQWDLWVFRVCAY